MDGLGGFYHSGYIGLADLTVFDGYHATAIEAADVTTGDAGVDACDFAISHQLGFFKRLLNAVYSCVNVDHYTALEAAAGRRAKAS